jgi:hypothetical protein
MLNPLDPHQAKDPVGFDQQNKKKQNIGRYFFNASSHQGI